MVINKIFFLKIAILINFVLVQTSLSQMSRKEINEERALYKSNKVKSMIIKGQNGYKSVTEIDRDGKKMKSNDFYDNKEANITNYVYDSFGRLIEESYYGYESGDGFNTKYYYDEEGNVESTITEGGDASKTIFKYDRYGTVTLIEIVDIALEPNPPYIMEFENNYKDEILTSFLQLCNFKIESTVLTNYTYGVNRLSSVEKFDKSCSDGTLKFYSSKTYSYFPNLLIKQISSESIDNEGIEITEYSYEFYK